MKNQWWKINEVERRYLTRDGGEVVILGPAALFISDSGTHYVSNEDDTKRVIVPFPFRGISSTVQNSNDWIYPEPRFTSYQEILPLLLEKERT